MYNLFMVKGIGKSFSDSLSMLSSVTSLMTLQGAGGSPRSTNTPTAGTECPCPELSGEDGTLSVCLGHCRRPLSILSTSPTYTHRDRQIHRNSSKESTGKIRTFVSREVCANTTEKKKNRCNACVCGGGKRHFRTAAQRSHGLCRS